MEELQELQKLIIAELKSAVTSSTLQCEGIDCLTKALATVSDILNYASSDPFTDSQVSGNK